MATFEVKVYKLTIEEHPNADAIELAKVGDYRSIVQKGQFKTGDLGVYIPCGAILSSLITDRLGLQGKLAGKQKNRVKEIRLRGILSEGLIYPVEIRKDVFDKNDNTIKDIYCITIAEGGAGHVVEEGDDVTKWLGITKYEPPIPICMQGEVFNAFGKTLKYDIENIKRFPDVFQDNEEVCITEKLHGTWCCFGRHPEVDTPIVASKGLSEKGLAFKFNEANKNNLYVRAYKATEDENGLSIIDRAREAFNITEATPTYILGEIFGAGIQDLTYGGEPSQFRIFDVYVGQYGKGRYLTPFEKASLAAMIGVPTVPVLYMGNYRKDIVDQYTDGMETASGKQAHMREGVVITPTTERRTLELGRVILKSVSEKYILRKGKPTEFN